jgi:hypothetical protein
MALFGMSEKEKQIAERARKRREQAGVEQVEPGIEEGDLIADYLMPLHSLKSALFKGAARRGMQQAGKQAAQEAGKETAEVAGKKSVKELAMPVAGVAGKQAQAQATKKAKDEFLGDLSGGQPQPQQQKTEPPTLNYAEINKMQKKPESKYSYEWTEGKWGDVIQKTEPTPRRRRPTT